MRHWICVGLSLLGCGGNATVGDHADDGAGAAGAVAGSAAGGAAAASCDDVEGCCAALCAHAATMTCWHLDDSCECGVGEGEACRAAWLTFSSCLVASIDDAVICDGEDIVLACGVCAPERAMVEVTCDRDIECGGED